MFSDELAKIVSSEDQSEQLIKDAKIQEKKILEDAKDKRDEIIGKAEEEGKDFYQSKIEEGNKTAQENYENFINDVKKTNSAMQDDAEAKLDEVANYIYERVVNSSVNS